LVDDINTMAEKIEKKAAIEIQRGRERTLLVDDEKSLLNLGEKMLTSLGYSVTVTNSSLDALNRFRMSPAFFDVVISDQTMPHMTGYHLAEELLRINSSARVILCTGHSDTLTSEKVATAGIKALLFKPIRKKEPTNAIRSFAPISVLALRFKSSSYPAKRVSIFIDYL
jgi:CheY-like chemotaxis protein